MFCVKELINYIQGLRIPVAMFEKYEDAEEYINSTNKQHEVKCWCGITTMYYIIEEYDA